jgi:hypothetical protein
VLRLAARGKQRADAFTALAEQEKREGNVPRGKAVHGHARPRRSPPLPAKGWQSSTNTSCADPAQALLYTRQALFVLAEPGLADGEAVQSRRNALQYRYARLRRKLANAKPQEDTP